MSSDPLTAYAGLAACPSCGCLERKGTVRCAECGTFHAGIHMDERKDPNPTVAPVERAPIDPTAYSLSGDQAVPEESFEETEEIVHWDGGSSDFTMEDVDEPPLARVDPDELEFPEPEDLSSVE
jgi:uncharacterized Zn finger protein (UPF0148 family)